MEPNVLVMMQLMAISNNTKFVMGYAYVRPYILFDNSDCFWYISPMPLHVIGELYMDQFR